MKKILLVDDEIDVLESFKMFLENLGYTVKTIDNGEDAISMIKKEHFDLVLLDILMPGMSGRDVLRKIRKTKKIKKQKVAFLSVVEIGENGNGIIKKLKPAAYIQKPIDIPRCKRKLKRILRE